MVERGWWSAEDERRKNFDTEIFNPMVMGEATEIYERLQDKKRAEASIYGGKAQAKPHYTTKLKKADNYGGTKQKKPDHTELFNDIFTEYFPDSAANFVDPRITDANNRR